MNLANKLLGPGIALIAVTFLYDGCIVQQNPKNQTSIGYLSVGTN